MDDLQAMVDALRFSEPVDGRQMDDLAGMLKNKLQLNLDQSAYRVLAENMVNLSITKNREQADHVRQNPSQFTTSPVQQQQQQQQQQQNFAPHPNSSFSNPVSSSFSNPISTTNGYRNDNGTQYNVIQQQLPNQTPVLSPNITQRRGRSPARTDNNPNTRMSPVRQIFGGIPRAGVSVSGKSSSTVNIERTRNVSPAPGPGFFRRTKGNEEKKDGEKKDSMPLNKVISSGAGDQSSAGSQRLEHTVGSSLRVDQSSGASPQKLPRTVGMGGQGRCHSPNPSLIFSNNQIHVPPCSPGHKPPTTRHSAPNSPVYTGMGGYVSSDRPPSRSGSPFNRPGLQDDGGGSETISGRSPRREQGTISFKPGVPMGHRRTRSSGVDVDIESSRQPHIPRSFSKSPLRRPSAAPEQDSDSIRQPSRPRPSTDSPHRDFPMGKNEAVESNYDEDIASGISMPDLSIPDFDPTVTPPSKYPFDDAESLMEIEQVNVNNIYKTAAGKLRRKDGTPFGNPSTQQSSMSHLSHPISSNDDGRFEFGTGPSNKLPKGPVRRPYRRGENRKGQQEAELFDNRNESTPAPNGADNSERLFSPMEVEIKVPEPGPPKPFFVGVSNPRLQEDTRHFASNIHGSCSLDGTDATVSTTPPSAEPSPNNFGSQIDYSGLSALIDAKRDEARSFYLAGDYGSSINAYTDAISTVGDHAGGINSESVALLLSNRAAALLMVGAFDASASDCTVALSKVNIPLNAQEVFSADSGLLLKIKLHTRRGRALLKLGEYNDAYVSFDDAIRTTEEAMAFSRSHHPTEMVLQNQSTLTQMNTEATLGQSDARRLREACEKLSKCTLQNLKYPVDRTSYSDALGCVNMALSMASGSVGLSETKLTILANMKRWREVAGFCERLAAVNVRLDNIFRDDLAQKNPFPGSSPAIHLKSNFFGNSRDEDVATRDLKLNSKAAGEAVLRLPPSLIPFYLRALRLEERYPAADSALRSLEEFMHHGFSNVISERSKLNRTKQGRERGDELFRTGDFDLAAAQYTSCLTIDAEGISDSMDGTNAGGRLHAVLHCNRAACLMALKRFHAAVDECTAALKIHARYMKAILRRARCYTRLQQIQEGIAEYKRWLELVDEATKPNYAASISSPCLFDGPNDVKAVEITQVKKELDDLYKAKRRTEAVSREEAERRREREKWQENFSSSWKSNGDAQQRREQWFDQQDGTRRWDSFKTEGPRSRSQSRTRSQDQGIPNSHSTPHAAVSPRTDPSRDHYVILNLSSNATMDDIKKSFRKLAVKYHPDKNKEVGATDNFLRIKLAHDTLSDPVKRMQYDSELRRKGRF